MSLRRHPIGRECAERQREVMGIQTCHGSGDLPVNNAWFIVENKSHEALRHAALTAGLASPARHHTTFGTGQYVGERPQI